MIIVCIKPSVREMNYFYNLPEELQTHIWKFVCKQTIDKLLQGNHFIYETPYDIMRVYAMMSWTVDEEIKSDFNKILYWKKWFDDNVDHPSHPYFHRGFVRWYLDNGSVFEACDQKTRIYLTPDSTRVCKKIIQKKYYNNLDEQTQIEIAEKYFKVQHLKELCKNAKIKKYSKLRKVELIKALISNSHISEKRRPLNITDVDEMIEVLW